MDRIDEWRIFAAVAGQRSFAKAARSLGRSPQAATRAVAALEDRLGARLLTRTTRSVALTDEGARCLERCRCWLAEFDQLEAGESDHPARGTLHVTAPVLFGQLHLSPIVREFLRDHEGVNVRLLLVDRMVSFVDEGVDLGVRIGALPDSTLRARTVGSVRSVLCASPAYLERVGTPRRPEDLTRHQCIAFTGTTPIVDRWSFPSDTGRERSVPVKPRLTVNTGQAAIDAALDGFGLVRALSYQVDELIKKNRLVPVLLKFEPEPLPVQIVQPQGAPVRAATLFADLAAERLRAKFPSF